jgi:sugar phosphate permease
MAAVHHLRRLLRHRDLHPQHRRHYYVDHFKLSLAQAGMAAGSFGLLALFARALGGWVSDKLPPAAT